jgi:hypothetical protein
VRVSRRKAANAPTTPAIETPMMFDVTQVRQALQHTVAIGALSPYFAAA